MDSELTVCSNVVARCSCDLHPGCAYMTSLRETEPEKDIVILRERDSIGKVLTIIFKILDFEVSLETIYFLMFTDLDTFPTICSR